MDNKDITASQVTEFMLNNPDFFIHNPELLKHINISHETKGATSLLQYQNKQLRIENKKIDQIIINAQYNDILFKKIQNIILDIIKYKQKNDILLAVTDKFLVNFDMGFICIDCNNDKDDSYKIIARYLQDKFTLDNTFYVIVDINILKNNNIDIKNNNSAIAYKVNNYIIILIHKDKDYFRIKNYDMIEFILKVISVLLLHQNK